MIWLLLIGYAVGYLATLPHAYRAILETVVSAPDDFDRYMAMAIAVLASLLWPFGWIVYGLVRWVGQEDHARDR